MISFVVTSRRTISAPSSGGGGAQISLIVQSGTILDEADVPKNCGMRPAQSISASPWVSSWFASGTIVSRKKLACDFHRRPAEVFRGGTEFGPNALKRQRFFYDIENTPQL